MVKIGPAFYDSLSNEKTNRRKDLNFVGSGLIYLFPLFFLILVFSIIGMRLFYVQVLRGTYYKGLADNNRTRTTIIEAPRGIIVDRRGRPLVANNASFKITKGDKSQEISEKQALSLIASGKSVKSEVVRNYLYKSAFAHVLGYVGQISSDEVDLPQFSDYGLNDLVGKAGLENKYEGLLHGVNGRQLYEVDARGEYVRELGREEPIAGQRLTTTLDIDVQLAVARAFKGVQKGAAVVSDPKNGAILAIYSKPSFDPNIFVNSKNYTAEGDYKTRESILLDSDKLPLLDRAISGVYPPGSTFKLVTATAALEKGAITGATQIEDTGVLKVGEFSFGNWYFLQYGRTDGNINVVGAIKRSNDIFFYKAAQETGVDNISSWAKTFGFGRKLNVDLPAEVAGNVPTVEWKEEQIGEPWYLGDTFNYGIGQGYLLSTPLQVNTMTNVFANDGVLYQPHFVQGKNKILKKDFVKRANIDLVRQGMVESCETGGVAWPFFNFKVKNDRLKIDGKDYLEDSSGSAKMTRIKVGCKTGTAETGGKEDKPHAWITVFAPYHKPEVTVTVLVENAGEGSSVAGPIARDILKDYFEKK